MGKADQALGWVRPLVSRRGAGILMALTSVALAGGLSALVLVGRATSAHACWVGRFEVNISVSVSSLCGGGGGGGTPSPSYDRLAAARYADAYEKNSNPNDPTFPQDCANFVSQSMNAGGLPMVGAGGDTTDGHNWWLMMTYTGSWQWQYSRTWSYAADNKAHWEFYSNPSMTWVASVRGDSRQATSGDSVGDPIYYDWGDGQLISHVTIMVAQNEWDVNSNSPMFYGDLIDGHTNPRLHAMWTLADYNDKRSSTTVYVYHLGI